MCFEKEGDKIMNIKKLIETAGMRIETAIAARIAGILTDKEMVRKIREALADLKLWVKNE